MKLIIAEKPSVAKTFADILGAKTKKDGYYEGGGYVVSWCIGHLLGLAEPATYDEKYAKWRKEDLPIKPTQYKYTPSASTKKQLSTLMTLMKRDDITEFINGADAGREGELIFGLVYEYAKSKKPVERLWISSMEEAAIKQGFNELKPSRDFQSLLEAAKCRQQADWFVGINYSRLFSVLYNANLNVGRVQTPTLAMVVDRTHKAKNFVKEPFYTVELSGLDFVATGERLTDKAQAEAVSTACAGSQATITGLIKQSKSTAPPKLYDLTTLQREANQLFGYTASQTLALAQSLYEKKLLTYPRTDSKFITDDMAHGITALMGAATKLCPFITLAGQNVNHIVDNAKVTDHHAIILTPATHSLDLSTLPTEEQNIVKMVAVKLMAAIADKHTYDETALSVTCAGQSFSTKGKAITHNGFKDIEAAFSTHLGKKAKEVTDTTLPVSLSEGQSFTAQSVVREGFTSPPKLYTEDTLLSAMENAGSEGVEEDIDRKGLGTPATRASIIENLVNLKYLVREKKNLVPTEKGVNLIKILPDAIKSPLLTAEWENNLKRMERGEVSPQAFMSEVMQTVENTISTQATPTEKNLFGTATGGGQGEVVGTCSHCKKEVRENSKAYSCSCGFVIFKDNKFFTSNGSKLTKTMAKQLITKGVTTAEFISKKTGKPYAVNIHLAYDGTGYPKFNMSFPQKKKK